MTTHTLQDAPKVDKAKDWFMSKCLNTQYRLVEDLYFKAMRLDIASADRAMNTHATAWGQYEALCAIFEGKVQS
jgi:leucyl aminopeptidase (aminopeptidase T)